MVVELLEANATELAPPAFKDPNGRAEIDKPASAAAALGPNRRIIGIGSTFLRPGHNESATL
jgi:hypothetical protein